MVCLEDKTGALTKLSKAFLDLVTNTVRPRAPPPLATRHVPQTEVLRTRRRRAPPPDPRTSNGQLARAGREAQQNKLQQDDRTAVNSGKVEHLLLFTTHIACRRPCRGLQRAFRAASAGQRSRSSRASEARGWHAWRRTGRRPARRATHPRRRARRRHPLHNTARHGTQTQQHVWAAQAPW